MAGSSNKGHTLQSLLRFTTELIGHSPEKTGQENQRYSLMIASA
jgi:hypothetical protein